MLARKNGGCPLFFLLKSMEYIRLWSITDRVVDELLRLLRVLIYERAQINADFE